MGNLQQYIIRIISCVLVCSIISQIIADAKRKALMRLICGIVLVLVLLQPLSRIDISDIAMIPLPELDCLEARIREGEKAAAEAKAEYIKTSCEAYIGEKAKKLGIMIKPQIHLDENLIPVFAEVEGALTADIQMQLQSILTDELGIPKENQKWIWNQENGSS